MRWRSRPEPVHAGRARGSEPSPSRLPRPRRGGRRLVRPPARPQRSSSTRRGRPLRSSAGRREDDGTPRSNPAARNPGSPAARPRTAPPTEPTRAPPRSSPRDAVAPAPSRRANTRRCRDSSPRSLATAHAPAPAPRASTSRSCRSPPCAASRTPAAWPRPRRPRSSRRAEAREPGRPPRSPGTATPPRAHPWQTRSRREPSTDAHRG